MTLRQVFCFARACAIIVVLLQLYTYGTARGAPSANSGKPRFVRVGETIRMQMPQAALVNKCIPFELLAEATDTVTIDARALDFDVALEVSRRGVNGELEILAKDDNSGTASNSRITVGLVASVPYRIVVRCKDEDLTGEFELQLTAGRIEPLDFKGEQQAEMGYWKAIEDRARENGDRVREAIGLNGRATILQARGEYNEARPLFERCVTLIEEAFGPEDQNLATNLNNLALLLQVMGSYGEAKPLYERALAIWEKQRGPQDLDVATAMNNLGIIHLLLGSYAEAKSFYERSLAIREEKLGPEDPLVANSLGNLAGLLQTEGDFMAAKPLFERSLAIREKQLGPEHPLVANGLSNLGALFLALGAYADGKAAMERALVIREKQLGTQHPLFAKTLNNVGSTLAKMGDYAGSKRVLERSLAISEKQLGPDNPDVIQTRADLADLALAMGSHAEAESLQLQCLALREKKFGPEHPHVAASLTSLAVIYRVQGAYAKAKRLCERALAYHEKLLGPDHPEVAKDLNALARIEALMGEREEALKDALRAEQLGRNHLRLTARVLPERQALRYATVRAQGLDLALSIAVKSGAGDPKVARETWESLIRSRALVLDEMAARHKALALANDPEIEALERKLTATSARYANLLVRGPGRDPIERYRGLLDDAWHEKEQTEQVLAGMSSAFRPDAGGETGGFDEIARDLPPKGALVAFALYNRYKVADSRTITSAADSAAATDTTGASRIVPSYLAFVLHGEKSEPVVVPLGPAEEIDRLVSVWQREAATGSQVSWRSAAATEESYRRAGARLRARVWDPLASHIGRARRIFVIPDGAINLVSLVALPVGKSAYLIEKSPLIHYLSAERDLTGSKAERTRGTGLLALGGPAFDDTSFATPNPADRLPEPAIASLAKASGPAVAPALPFRGERSDCSDFAAVQFEALPGSLREVGEITVLWNSAAAAKSDGMTNGTGATGATEWTGDAANEAAFKRGAPGRRVLHLATHGFFLGGACRSALETSRGVATPIPNAETAPRPLEATSPPPMAGENPLHLSGLAFAGANLRSVVRGDEDDGILTAEEIASLDLSGVEWAVLSACETGVGDVRAGEGMFGLRRAFQVAGVGALITSLWSVEDESTRAWMRSLYEGRLENHLDTAEAARRAGLEVLRDHRARKQSTHPFYWGAFVAAGDWR